MLLSCETSTHQNACTHGRHSHSRSWAFENVAAPHKSNMEENLSFFETVFSMLSDMCMVYAVLECLRAVRL